MRYITLFQGLLPSVLLVCSAALVPAIAYGDLRLGNVYECPADLPPVNPEVPKPSIELFVNEPWLTAIREGRKKVEGRAGTRQTYANWVGQQVRFCSAEQEVIVTVLAVHHYETLSAFLDAEGWQNAAPHLGSREETTTQYLEFYPGDFIARHGGMNGIIIEVNNSTATR